MATGIARLYPFKSGCGSFANTRIFRYLDPVGGKDSYVKVCGGTALIPAGDYVGRAMRFVGDLDPKISWVIDRAVTRGDVALDIGSNLGLVSLRLASRVGATGQVHAFEPQPRLQAYFRQTMQANPQAKITLHGVALGHETAKLRLSIPDGNAGMASLVPDDAALAQGSVSVVEVAVRPLSEYARQIGLDRIDFIKMDVEGFEANVIAGAMDILARTRPKVIVLEENAAVAPDRLPPSLGALRDLDYDLFALPRRLFSVALLPLSENLPAHDYVAVSRAAPPALRRDLNI